VSDLLSKEDAGDLLHAMEDHAPEDIVGTLRLHISALEKGRDAALADNATLLAGVQRMRNLLLYPTVDADKTRAEVLRVGLDLVTHPCPGTALLEEHRKALEAAHADGRRHALLQAIDRLGMDSAYMYGDPGATDTWLGDELWNHVRWLEARAKNEGLEKAAARIESMADASRAGGYTAHYGDRIAAARVIRAMKEPVPDGHEKVNP
jgi:hypothetical protein